MKFGSVLVAALTLCALIAFATELDIDQDVLGAAIDSEQAVGLGEEIDAGEWGSAEKASQGKEKAGTEKASPGPEKASLSTFLNSDSGVKKAFLPAFCGNECAVRHNHRNDAWSSCARLPGETHWGKGTKWKKGRCKTLSSNRKELGDAPLTLEAELTKGVMLNQSEWQGQFRHTTTPCTNSNHYWCQKNVWLKTLHGIKSQVAPRLKFDPNIFDFRRHVIMDLVDVTQASGYPNMPRPACRSRLYGKALNKTKYTHCINIMTERVTVTVQPRTQSAEIAAAVRNLLPDAYSAHSIKRLNKKTAVRVEIAARFFKEVRCIAMNCQVIKRGSLDPLVPALVASVFLWHGGWFHGKDGLVRNKINKAYVRSLMKQGDEHAAGWVKLAQFGNLSIQYNATEEDISSRLASL